MGAAISKKYEYHNCGCYEVFTYLIADSDGQESFDGDCNDEDEYGDQTFIFDVIASSVGKTSDHPNLFDNLNESDLLDEDFISKSFLKVNMLSSEPSNARHKV